MATLQEMLSKKIAENKAESLAKTTTPVAPKAPVVSSPTVNPTSTVEKPADFINFEQAKPVSETKAPVPTSITQGVTPKVSVTTPGISEPTKVTPPTTTPKIIGEENGQPIYERKTTTTTTPGVTGTDLNLPTAKGTLESPTYSFDVKDPNNYMGTGMTLEQFKTLPLETQSAYTNAALANEQQKQGLIKQVEYATDVTKQKELMEKQRAIKVQTDQLSSENQAIQDNQQVAKARQDLDTLKQNIGFLGQGGRPVQSQQVIDSYDRMLTTSEQQFQDMVKIQNNMKQMRELGIQFDTNAYQAHLDQIHTELKRNVDSVIQDAINGFSADQMSGMIDSPESLQKLQDKYNSMIDQSVMGLTNKSIANLQTMQEVYKGKIATAQQEYQAYQESMAQYQKQQAEQQATFLKNENTLNKDMSEALGYYVNANGKPLMTTEGTTIAVKKDMPAPIFDRESGVMVTFEPDAKGNPVGVTKQIMQPSQSAQMELLLKQAQLDKLKTIDTGNWKLQDGLLVNDKTGETRSTTTMGGATGDLRGLASQFPGQARAKNNNPAGITWNANFDKGTGTAGLLQQAGIRYEKGTPRPSGEGGNYVTFPTIEEGLAAQRILMTQTYGNNTVQSMLGKWVGTGEALNYAKQVAGMAGVPLDATVNQLTDEQLQSLQSAKIKKESPGLYKLMQQPATDGNKPLTKEEKSTLFSIQDDLKSDPRRKEYLTLQSKIKTLDGIKTRLDTGKATAQDKQQLISDFAKVLDPTSVVRTEEYALAAKYGQSAINKTIQEISNWYSTNGPLSDTSAKVLAEAVGLRYEATKSSNDEAIQEQKKRAEIFLGRPVTYDELAVTQQQTTTPPTTQQDQDVNDEDIALFNKYM